MRWVAGVLLLASTALLVWFLVAGPGGGAAIANQPWDTWLLDLDEITLEIMEIGEK